MATIGAVLGAPSPSRGAESSWNDSAEICVSFDRKSSLDVNEAVLRIEAELGAVGFIVKRYELSVPPEADACQGRILLQLEASHLLVSTATRANRAPLVQEIDPQAPSTTQELIAIRAVEGLRASLLEAVADARATGMVLPSSVRAFTHLEPDAPEPAPRAEKSIPPPHVAPPEQPPVNTEHPRPPLLLLTLGPELAGDGAQFGTLVQITAHWLLGPVVLGVLGDLTAGPGRWEVSQGTIEVRHYSVIGHLGLRAPITEELELLFTTGFGVRQLALEARNRSTPPEVENESHLSPLLDGGLLIAYLFDGTWGLSAQGRVGTLLNAPRLELGTARLDWGRPTWNLTFGLAVRF